MQPAAAPMPLADANMFTVMLVQSLWGAISPNFRTVALSMKPEGWKVLFVLEAEDARDRETIDEVIEDFSCLITGYEPPNLRLENKVLVTAGSLPALDHNQWRVVFLRRES
jgi:hypothetical protein